ncbi:LIC20153 family lipoprotein [Leptospira perolatii]|uniref:LIC20153 family lipoprotein n=1 Tax=Leptospira perolatii TaxID=2023191 RepID=UPI000F631C51|nr:hypothetical protein [Leptospira perolatii]
MRSILIPVSIAILIGNCKKEEPVVDNGLSQILQIVGVGNCLVQLPQMPITAVDRTLAVKNGGKIPFIWKSMPMADHPVALIEVQNVQDGDIITFNEIDVVNNPIFNDQSPTIYAASDCPLSQDSTFDNSVEVRFNKSGSDSGPYVYTNNQSPGTYFFLFHIYVEGTKPANATVEFR